MAMGNYCYIQRIECPFANTCGQCVDDIYDDFGLCEMMGDDMPPKELLTEERRAWCLRAKSEEVSE